MFKMIDRYRLHLGCGYIHMAGWINIDSNKGCHPDKVIDIEREFLPFNNETVCEIFSNHFFEHIGNFEFVLSECHRVMSKGAVMTIIVPYCTALAGDYEYHKIRPRYNLFMDFEEGKGMRLGLPKFKIERKLVFSWYLYPLNIINLSEKLIHIYEQTGIRYLFPAMNVELKMIK